MRAFVTGATGFIGSRVARELRRRGDEVVALVRSPEKAGALREAGCEVVGGDLSDLHAIRRGMKGADAVFHMAAIYQVGVPRSWRPRMFEANVAGTERVLDAAIEAGATRIVYVSTVNVFGNTKGRIVDETYARDEREGFLSIYDETKYLAHRAAEQRIASGAPIVIPMPGAVYGPGDPSNLGSFVEQVRRGKLKAMTFPDMGLNLVHVDDAAFGIVLVHDGGGVGESYVLGGQIMTLGDLIRTVARLSGRKSPRVTLPPVVAKMGIPFGRLVGRLMGTNPNLRELIRVADGVTYWATDARARRELGYAPRDLETGLRQTFEAAV